MTAGKIERIFSILHIMNKVLITICCGLVVTAVFTFFMMGLASDPVDLSINLLNSEVAYNDFLKIDSKNFRHELCKTGSGYHIIDSGGNRIELAISPRTDVPGPLGEEDFIRRIRIRRVIDQQPGPIPGPAEIYLKISWVCPGNYYQAIFPKTKVLGPLKFTILDQDAPRSDPEQNKKGD